MTSRHVLQAIPKGWGKTASVALAIAGIVMVFGRDWVELPAQVETGVAKDVEHDRRLDELERGRIETQAQYRRLVCLITLPDSVSGIQAERECP